MSNNENNPFANQSGNFGLPGDYFQKSARSIFNKIEWEDEHKAYPGLLSLRGKHGFLVPVHYFEHGEEKLEFLNYPTLASVSKQNSFSVPEGYFEGAEMKEFLNVMTDQSDELAGLAVLSAIEKKNSFVVSDDYFAVNEKLLTTYLQSNKSARLFDLFFSRASYVAAALFVMSLGLWLYSMYVRPVNQMQDCGTMACVDKADLVKARNLENLDSDELYELVNPGDLEKTLDNKTNKPTKHVDSSQNVPLTDELIDDI